MMFVLFSLRYVFIGLLAVVVILMVYRSSKDA